MQNKIQYVTIKSSLLTVRISNLGATIRDIIVNTDKGQVDVALGLTDEQFEQSNGLYMGATVGRCCNRIAYGKFTLNGKEYSLYCNNGTNHLHGGKVGFDRKLFDIVSVTDSSVTMHYLSVDGEEGYDGNLDMTVTFAVNGGDLSINYKATTDKDTLFNPTNHTYFNLSGQNDGNATNNVVQILASHYTPLNENMIPLGTIESVEGSAMDLRKPRKLADCLKGIHPQLKLCGGFDHNYCLDNGQELACRAFSPITGIMMEVKTDRRGVQFYTGNFISSMQGKGIYNKQSGYCFETQCYPNAINEVNFGTSPVLKAGDHFNSTTVYSFSVSKVIKA